MTYTEAKTTEEIIMESLAVLRKNVEVTELRILKTTKGTVSGCCRGIRWKGSCNLFYP